MEDASVRTASPTVDNLVNGGRLASSMVAIRLASAGRQVTLLEKESAAHHKVCGEFLSYHVCSPTASCGLSGIAHRQIISGTPRAGEFLRLRTRIISVLEGFKTLELPARRIGYQMCRKTPDGGLA